MAWQGVDDRSADLTRKQRRKAGAAHRADVPLEAHAELADPARRGDPVEILQRQDVSRLSSLVPIRHGRMSATAFTFYRGAAAVMAADLDETATTSLGVQLCGDAHLANFGIFNGPDGTSLFDVNDFDETLPGPFEWDVKRLAASVAVAGRNSDLSAKQIRRAALAATAGYRTVLARAAKLDPLALHNFRLEFGALIERHDDLSTKKVARAQAKAQRKNSLRAFDKLTEVVDGRRRIVHDPPLITRLDDLDTPELDDIHTFLRGYTGSLPNARRHILQCYRLVDMAHKIVGVGSVGTRCLIMLLQTGDGDPLFLQFKEATASVLEPYLGSSRFEQSGQRVVEGQRLMQAAGDVFLGWSRIDGSDGQPHDFYFRQLWDGKGSADLDELGSKRLRGYARVCGGALALAHARSADASIISGYLGKDETFDHAVAEFADAYADLNERDHAAHVTAIASGRVEAVHDL